MSSPSGILIDLSEWFIGLYRNVAPNRLRNSCRFEPSCSKYALIAIRQHGAIKGWRLALRRIGRCRHPHGGIDFPP
ncbi:membrane protein insertion efficiency factor YidD [Robbsia andropogonis]|nr:membrane protein insertion efficiency factor YidD [Robbsia andropogonis]